MIDDNGDWIPTNAAGDPISDIIGEYMGDIDIVDGRSFDIGISLAGGTDCIGWNPFKAIGRATKKVSRAVKTVTNPLTRPIGRAATTIVNKVPLAKDVVHFVTQETNLVLTPERFLAGAATGLATGGLKGAARGIKHEAGVTAREARRYIQNPIVRYGTKGAALIFPPLTPVAAGVEAANQVIAAIQGKDPIKAALAITTVANSVAAANGGDLDALRAVKTIKAVKDNVLPKDITDMAKKASFVIPKGATKKSAVAAAHGLLTLAKGGGSASAAAAAQSVIKNTIKKAKLGDPVAKAGAAVLAATHKAQKALPAKPGMRAVGRVRGSYRKANRAAKGKTFTGAYLVDSRGNVVKGNFAAK